MKKILFTLSVSVLALIACEEINETYEDPATQLDVSSSYVIFDADGGTKLVLVTCNTEWTYSYDADWFRVIEGDGSLKITADGNYSPDNLQDIITVTAGANGELTKTISVAQLTVEGEDLSENESANCYLVKTGTTYRFNAGIKGNGVVSDLGGIGAYIDQYGVTIDTDEIVYADLLWEAALDGDKTRSCNIIDGDPIYSNGYVHFTTGEAEGNAVIAVKDAGDNVLWSWHIWVCDSEIEETQGNGYYWQDRNLGATSKEPGDINNRGLLYQWGRKDPFLPSCAEYGAEDANVYNSQVGEGSGSWNYTNLTAKGVITAPGNIYVSVKNPMSIILASGSVYSWYITKSNTDNAMSYLWGRSNNSADNAKSIFDPCPPGYNVPGDNSWYSDVDSNVNAWYPDDNGYGQYWLGGNGAYYPLSGAILGTTGAIADTSTYGYYWTSFQHSSSTNYNVYSWYFNTSSTFYYATIYPVHALAVRCMRVE